MPYKSKAQARYFHWLESKGKLPKSVNLDEYDHATDFEGLPEKMSDGGLVGYPGDLDDDPYINDEDEGYTETSSTGAPDDEDEKKEFIKQLRRSRG